jgi:hypothetical protein
MSVMPAIFETGTLVVFTGGFSADWRVVSRLLDLEARGATFELKADGGFRGDSRLGAYSGRYDLPTGAPGRGAKGPRVSGAGGELMYPAALKADAPSLFGSGLQGCGAWPYGR